MIQVYHASRDIMRDSLCYAHSGEEFKRFFDELELMFRFSNGDYYHVAAVDTDDLDIAYEQTNTIHQPWRSRNPLVVANEGKHRPTCVGDVLIRDGRMYAVASFGFDYLGDVKDFPVAHSA